MSLERDLERLRAHQQETSSTDALIADARENHPDLDGLDTAIGASIDALYAARDAGLTMHHAGALAAVAALEAAKDA